MAGPKLTLYVDLVSPFAYLAFHIVRTSPVFKKCEVTYIPVFLGGIMNYCGNTAPINIKNKGEWVGLERLRWARYFNVPMADTMPPGFPALTVSVGRALCAVNVLAPEKLSDVIAALFHISFAERKPIDKPNDFLPVIAGVLGEKGAKDVAEKIGTAEIKGILTANTEKACAEGAFGLPWFIATNTKGETEKYWGFDHLGQVIDHLGLQRPVAADQPVGGWRAML